MIVTVALDDINSVCPNISDRNKVLRERRQSRMKIVESTNYKNIISIYFNERKDHILVMERSEEKRAKKEIIEEHIIILSEPGSKYSGHFVPVSGAEKDIANWSFSILCRKAD